MSSIEYYIDCILYRFAVKNTNLELEMVTIANILFDIYSNIHGSSTENSFQLYKGILRLLLFTEVFVYAKRNIF